MEHDSKPEHMCAESVQRVVFCKRTTNNHTYSITKGQMRTLMRTVHTFYEMRIQMHICQMHINSISRNDKLQLAFVLLQIKIVITDQMCFGAAVRQVASRLTLDWLPSGASAGSRSAFTFHFTQIDQCRLILGNSLVAKCR